MAIVSELKDARHVRIDFHTAHYSTDRKKIVNFRHFQEYSIHSIFGTKKNNNQRFIENWIETMFITRSSHLENMAGQLARRKKTRQTSNSLNGNIKNEDVKTWDLVCWLFIACRHGAMHIITILCAIFLCASNYVFHCTF